jgi:hypothetical protein
MKQKTRWPLFTYCGSETRAITKLFRNINIAIEYKTNNTIRNHLKPIPPKTYIYNQSGVYQLKCNNCPLKYIRQTGGTFRPRYKEHVYAIRTNRPSSKYAEHMLDEGHTWKKHSTYYTQKERTDT